MKKKTRIIGSISALALSMAMLTGGVLAASQVSLNVSSTVSFNAQGVYLKAEGQVKRGAGVGSLENLTTSANYTYTGYSYNPDASGEPDGTSYTNTAMRDQAGSTAGWQIGEVEFTETEKVLQYAITFTNYSEFDVSITITPNVAASLTGVTTSSSGNEITVAAKSGETPGTASYTFTMTLNNFSSSVDGAVSLDISAEKYVEQLYNVTVNVSGGYGGFMSALPDTEDIPTIFDSEYTSLSSTNSFQVKDYLFFDFCNTTTIIRTMKISYNIDGGDTIEVYDVSDNDGGTSGIENPGVYTHKIEITKDCTINIIAEYTGMFV